MKKLVIIGAGPAGITAGVYAARKRIDFLMISEDVGGQAALSGDVENYTGYQFVTGAQLVEKFQEHLEQFRVDLRNNTKVEHISKSPQGTFWIQTQGEHFEAKAVIVATGRRSRWLDVEGEERYRNKGVSYCATCDGPLFANKTVAVIGGGNAALDATLQMMNIAHQVYVVDINSELAGDAIMQEKVRSSKKVILLNSAKVVEIYGDQFVSGIKVESEGQIREIPLEGVMVEIGSVPNSQIVDFADKNNGGEIMVDNLNRTSVAGLFAAGDVTDILEKQIIVAAGEGAKSVLGAFRYLSQTR